MKAFFQSKKCPNLETIVENIISSVNRKVFDKRAAAKSIDRLAMCRKKHSDYITQLWVKQPRRVNSAIPVFAWIHPFPLCSHATDAPANDHEYTVLSHRHDR